VQRHSASERVLKIPLLEGPENIEYETVDINIILPEGSRYPFPLSYVADIEEICAYLHRYLRSQRNVIYIIPF
jgi:Ribophorin I